MWATPLTHATGTVIAAETGPTMAGMVAANKDTGNPTVITAPATGSASGLATSETTGIEPKTINETGSVPT
jgi:hypothetical protein